LRSPNKHAGLVITSEGSVEIIDLRSVYVKLFWSVVVGCIALQVKQQRQSFVVILINLCSWTTCESVFERELVLEGVLSDSNLDPAPRIALERGR
jgi:hypothetical protein